MNVGNVCRTEVVTITGGETLVAAARLMRERHVGLLVIVEPSPTCADLLPVGVLSDRDIVTAVIAKDADVHALKVTDVMARYPLLAAETQPVGAILSQMRDAGVRRVPVVGARGQLTGILSLDDVLEAFAGQFADVATAIRNQKNRERATRT